LNVLQNNIYDKLQLKEIIMSKLKHLFRALLLLLALSATFLFNTTAQSEDNTALDWPGLYDPFTVLNLRLEVADGYDLDTILNDTTYDIEIPAWFWADGEESHKILVSIRRKSATAIPNELDPNKKVSYKVDINEYKNDPSGASSWHGIKKLSLENGDDENVVKEGFAWYLHRLASNSGLDYQSGLASWINLYIDGQFMGVYVNVEQPDKQYLKNRELWEGGDNTWLYKMSSIDSPEAKEAPEDDSGNVIDSPESEALCYKPFKDRGRCATPSDFKDQLNNNINMEGMLTLGAISAFHRSPDDLFSKGKNFYYTDALGRKREYMQWDLDSAFGS
jgi:spore coat protein CotH